MTKKLAILILSLIMGVLSNCGLFEPDPEPAKLQLNVQALDFGSNSTTQVFSVQNGGEQDLNWNIQSYPDWLTLAPLSGKGEMAVTATAALNSLEPGISTGEIQISSNAGTQTLPVSIELPLELLKYDNNSGNAVVTVGQVDGILWVRFTRPMNWAGCALRKVELNVLQDSTNAPFDIVYQDDYYIYESNYYPKTYTFSTLMNDCSQNTQLKQWDVDKRIFSSKHFFVGIRVSSSKGPYLFADNSAPFSVRSGANYRDYPYNRIVLQTKINLYVRIYVTPADPYISKIPAPDEAGVWFEATSFDEGTSGGSRMKIVK